MADPLHQFQIQPLIELFLPDALGGYNISFTNSALWMAITAVAISVLMLMGARNRSVIPGRIQIMGEMLYNSVASMIRDNVGSAGRPFFPFVFTLFVFVLFGNLFGLIPGSFTFTSHIIVTFTMALFIFVGVTLIGIFKNGFKFFNIFLPSGVPVALWILIIPIEVISYFSRPVSLSVRLFANMTVGHVVLKLLAGFVVSIGATLMVAEGLGKLGGIAAILPLALLVPIFALEFIIALIQAYVFAILSCIYLSDALHPSH